MTIVKTAAITIVAFFAVTLGGQAGADWVMNL